MVSKFNKLIDRARCNACDADVLRALVRPIGELPRRFIDLNPVPIGYAPGDHDLEREIRDAGIRTFGIFLGVCRERDGQAGRLPERIHAQHWCSPAEDVPLRRAA